MPTPSARSADLGKICGKICRPPATPSARSADCRQDLPQNRQFPLRVGKVGISRGEFVAERGKICRPRGKICRGVGKSAGELNPIRANSGEFTRIEAGHAADLADPASSCRVYPHSLRSKTYSGRTTRKPRKTPATSGKSQLRSAARAQSAEASKPPPRLTRKSPEGAPCGSSAGLLV